MCVCVCVSARMRALACTLICSNNTVDPHVTVVIHIENHSCTKYYYINLSLYVSGMTNRIKCFIHGREVSLRQQLHHALCFAAEGIIFCVRVCTVLTL